MPDEKVVTPHWDTVKQAVQAAEGNARESAGNAIPPNETNVALETTGDGSPQDPGGDRTQRSDAPEQPQKPTPPVISPYDQKRDEIRARFRAERGQQTAENTDQISDFMRADSPPEIVQETEPQPEGEPHEEVQDIAPDSAPSIVPDIAPETEAPKTLRLKVNGKEMDVPLDEVIAKAQMAIASDGILDKAKNKLAEVDQFVEQIRKKAAQPGQDGHHADPHGQQTEQPAEADAQNRGEGKKLVEAFQFGDPEEAERLFNQEINRRTDAKVKTTVAEQLLQERLRSDGARAAAVLKEFADKHPDIASDESSRAVIEVNTLRLQVEDLRQIGVDPEKLRPDGLKPTAADIANAHRFYRAEGFAVRPPSELLETAFGKFQEWKGITKQPTADPAQGQPPHKAAPRVAVSVERQERRQAVQQQPSRTAAPRQIEQPAAQRDRSDIVKAMQKRQATLRGTNLGIG